MQFKALANKQVIISFISVIWLSMPGYAQEPLTSESKKEISPTEPLVCTAVASHQRQVDALLGLMQQRLLLMHDVARWKWNSQSPIEDSVREQELLNSLENQAVKFGLDRQTLRTFFQAQIDAGKLIQTADFQRWQAQGATKFADVPDLKLILRPALDRLSNQLLETLAKLSPIKDCLDVQQLIRCRAEVILRGNGVDEMVRNQSLAPLLKVEPKI
ncbi:MAG: gamma subclass chorismate mutase AroQ [Aphanothece sp. CMT-3BRIN-NPC111]|jgi:chorismate mutase|nr:gamma subclass chorismate mutase AroQ [Aphanothece sp. CMT-3BRIN-NPC111]